MMRDKMALLPGIGQTHHHVFIRLVACGYKNSNYALQHTCSMACYVDTNTQ